MFQLRAGIRSISAAAKAALGIEMAPADADDMTAANPELSCSEPQKEKVKQFPAAVQTALASLQVDHSFGIPDRAIYVVNVNSRPSDRFVSCVEVY